MLIYARKLGPQVAGLIDCGDEERIATGEFDVFAFDCGSARVAQLKAKGVLIGWTGLGPGGFGWLGKNAILSRSTERASSQSATEPKLLPERPGPSSTTAKRPPRAA